ncbi:MAG: hypothetical protein K2X81_01645 [Candidatus Obscuribacterales bacterium]|nr:hypothetical protein [Candidatus Obscuribacterales bacterium]
MKIDQYMGLNDWARKLVNTKVKVREHGVRIFSDGTRMQFSRWARIPVVRKEHAGAIASMSHKENRILHRYTLPSGVQYTEYLQACPGSGGPCYFIALKDSNGVPVPDSLWTKDEIHHC